MTPQQNIAIIGGGIAGLASAYYLKKAGHQVTLFEASNHWGGKIISRTVEGCLLEGGPDSLLTEKPWALDLCRELGIEDELLPSNDAQRSFSILHNHRLHPFPAGCKLFIPQKVTPILTTPLLSIPGKARMLMEPFINHKKPQEDESLADFTRRHFGQETLNRLAGPLLGGIYGGDPEDMSMAATFPRLRMLENKHGSLVKGMASMMKMAKQRERAGTAPSLFTSLKSGMQKLPDTLAAHLSDHLRPNHRVKSLQKNGQGWLVDGEAFDRVVIALPAVQAAELFAELDPEFHQLLQRQQTSSSATLSLVFDRKDLSEIPGGFGFMSSHPLQSLLVGCTWTGTKFNHREADDRFICRLFLGGPFAHEAIVARDEQALVAPALEKLREICPFIPATPRAHWLQFWPNGNPGYQLGHLDWVKEIHTHTEALGNLHLLGSSYQGVSVSDCVKQAQDLASQ
ncbi:protoporphyrinogen oxidase [Kiritimatiellota bacterium B12222]|nr:protoporphyrinogen oxidase [Kiritimatiellota bacterium B12222]